jgi:hypothetical protein
MKKMLIAGLVSLSALVAATGTASAVVIHDDGFTGPYGGEYRPTDTSFSVSFNAGHAGSVAFSFDVFGGRTLDGVGVPWDDIFLFSFNSASLFSSSYDLGGGGSNTTFFDGGLTATTPFVFGYGLGGTFTISGVLNAVAGTNTLTFLYSSVAGTGYAGFQGTGDESWGINNVDVNLSAVPLPGALPLFMLGLAGLGATLRGRKKGVRV